MLRETEVGMTYMCLFFNGKIKLWIQKVKERFVESGPGKRVLFTVQVFLGC